MHTNYTGKIVLELHFFARGKIWKCRIWSIQLYIRLLLDCYQIKSDTFKNKICFEKCENLTVHYILHAQYYTCMD